MFCFTWYATYMLLFYCEFSFRICFAEQFLENLFGWWFSKLVFLEFFKKLRIFRKNIKRCLQILKINFVKKMKNIWKQWIFSVSGKNILQNWFRKLNQTVFFATFDFNGNVKWILQIWPDVHTRHSGTLVGVRTMPNQLWFALLMIYWDGEIFLRASGCFSLMKTVVLRLR